MKIGCLRVIILHQKSVKVREDLPEGTIIMWLEAHDPDLGQSSQVRYSLLDHGEGNFDVDKLSGAVRIIQQLDFEKKQVYNLTVRAKDKGKPISLSSTCYVEVEVIDVNENLHPPVFPSFVEKGAVKENAPLGSSVMKVSARDEDMGRDGEIHYSIRDGSGVGVFRIDEETGECVLFTLACSSLSFLSKVNVPRVDSFTVPLWPLGRSAHPCFLSCCLCLCVVWNQRNLN